MSSRRRHSYRRRRNGGRDRRRPQLQPPRPQPDLISFESDNEATSSAPPDPTPPAASSSSPAGPSQAADKSPTHEPKFPGKTRIIVPPKRWGRIVPSPTGSPTRRVGSSQPSTSTSPPSTSFAAPVMGAVPDNVVVDLFNASHEDIQSMEVDFSDLE